MMGRAHLRILVISGFLFALTIVVGFCRFIQLATFAIHHDLPLTGLLASESSRWFAQAVGASVTFLLFTAFFEILWHRGLTLLSLFFAQIAAVASLYVGYWTSRWPERELAWEGWLINVGGGALFWVPVSSAVSVVVDRVFFIRSRRSHGA